MSEIKYILKKPLHILKGIWLMIKKYKLYFLLPVCLLLAVIAMLVYYVGPAIIVSFIYAGI